MFAYCLTDFFNLRLWRRGGEPGFADIRDGLQDLIAAALDALGLANLTVQELTVRLYGGWYGESLENSTAIYSLTAAVIRQFPRRMGTRLRVEIADAPIWERGLRLPKSLRKIPFKSQGGTFVVPSGCPHAAACSIVSLEAWMKGRCPETNCSVRLAEVGWNYRQKMVDTLITADALTIAQDELGDALLIASDDDDVLPAILSLQHRGLPIIRLCRKDRQQDYYTKLLSYRGILIHTW